MRKLPKSTKKLTGTYRPDKEFKGIEAGERLNQVPEPPDFLSVGAKKEWQGLAPVLVQLGVLTIADLRDLGLCCEALATVTELENVIRAEGFTVATATGSRKGHPALKALETTRNQAHRMLEAFGLNPRARKFVEKAPEQRNEYGARPTRFRSLNSKQDAKFRQKTDGILERMRQRDDDDPYGPL